LLSINYFDEFASYEISEKRLQNKYMTLKVLEKFKLKLYSINFSKVKLALQIR